MVKKNTTPREYTTGFPASHCDMAEKAKAKPSDAVPPQVVETAPSGAPAVTVEQEPIQ